MSPFEKIMELTGLEVRRVDPSKVRCLTMKTGGAISYEGLSKKLATLIGPRLPKYPKLGRIIYDQDLLQKEILKYAEANNLIVETVEQGHVEIPPEFRHLTLNLDMTHSGRDLKFFCTTPDEYVSAVSGPVYINTSNMELKDALTTARRVVPQYQPRSGSGIEKRRMLSGEELPVFNNYVPPDWALYKGDVPDRLPRLFENLVNHLFPIKVEREYFFAWLHDSLFSRSFVYLILCGPPATGKNRLKLVLRALHGHQNTVDGKRSTLVERFNSQLSEATLAWFDELTYNMDMENVMKELQNDSISIERKGVDATRSTQIFSSLVISNNKPRDNYIAFDARKFAPLVVTPNRLDTVMTPAEIEELTGKVENVQSPTYDIEFIAQIGRWIQKHGRSKKWPHLEYKGPMFYRLAHTSMSQWQKRSAMLVFEAELRPLNLREVKDKKGHLWSKLVTRYSNRNGDRSKPPPDFSTVKHFFDIFVDSEGRKAFETEIVRGSIMSDFYVRLINKNAKIMTESEVIEANGGDSEEVYDL